MGKDLFKYLPSELIIDMLSRLPVRTNFICKCVVKSWCSLIETPAFVESYESVPCLAGSHNDGKFHTIKVYEVEDEVNRDYSCNLVFKFDLPDPVKIHSSINGLLLLFHRKSYPHRLFICNPVTREFIYLPKGQLAMYRSQFQLDVYGFGVSKTSGECKVVRIFYEGYRNFGSGHYLSNASLFCQYTLLEQDR